MEGGNSRRRLISTTLSTQHNNPDGLHTHPLFFYFREGKKKRKKEVWRDWWFIYLGEEEDEIELYI